MRERRGQLSHRRDPAHIGEIALHLPQSLALFLGPLAFGEIEHEHDSLGTGPFDRRCANQRRHAAPVAAEIFLLEDVAGAGRSELRHGALTGDPRFRRRQLGPAQPSRHEIVARVSNHLEERVVGLDDPAVIIRNQHTHDVGVDQAADFGFPLLELAIQTAVLERHGRLRRQQLQHRDLRRGEDGGREVVLEVEQRDQPGLLHQRKAQDGTGVLSADVLIAGERAGARGVIENHALVCTRGIVEHRLRQLFRRRDRVAQPHGYCASGGARFGLNPEVVTLRQNQQSPLGTRVLDGCPQQCVDEFFEDNLTGHRLRDLEDG